MYPRRSCFTYGLMAVVTMFLILSSIPAFAADYSRMVVFGDSLSDRGNLNRIVPSQPVTWADGDVWVDYLARELVIPNSRVSNNAFGGALTSGHEVALALATDGDPSNDAQIPTFQALGLDERVAAYVASSPDFRRDRPEETLFVMWIGANDLAAYFARLQAQDPTLPDAATYIGAGVGRIAQAMGRLAGIGARHFLIVNLPDIAQTPRFAAFSQQVRAQVTQLTQAWNGALAQAVNAAQTQIGSDAVVHTFDSFRYFNAILAGNTFANTRGTLVVLDQQGRRTSAVNTPASDYLWWDPIHPTTQAHGLFAREVFNRNFKPLVDEDYRTVGITGRGGVGERMAPDADTGYFYLLADGQMNGYAMRGDMSHFFRTSTQSLHEGDGNSNWAKRGAGVKKIVEVETGDTLTFRYKFLTNRFEYPGTDYGFFYRYNISTGDGQNLVRLADITDAVNETTGNNPFVYETGFKTHSITFDRAGKYLIGFGVINSEDNAIPSAMVIDSVELNGALD